jgi:hypothetical protein
MLKDEIKKNINLKKFSKKKKTIKGMRTNGIEKKEIKS